MTPQMGIYAPITEEGTIVVDGVAASCFANQENERLQEFAGAIHSVFNSLVRHKEEERNAFEVPLIYLALNKLQKYLVI